MKIVTRAYPRAALVGNPSDGYFGKTIAFVFGNFHAEVTLHQTPELEILLDDRDKPVFASIDQLVDEIGLYGYYGGTRLIKAAIKRFFDYCKTEAIAIDRRNFTISYNTTIPYRLGLAGSSAIITACMRALMQFYDVTIPKPQLANLILSVEKGELKIEAGLQDRVVQVYQGLVYMDFNKVLMEERGYGIYQNLDASLLPNLYIAYSTKLAEGSEITHNELRERYDHGDKDVLTALTQCAELSVEVNSLLESDRANEIAAFLNRNFDLRKSMLNIGNGNQRMVDIARSLGASANFTGSGGAIVGTYSNQAMYDSLQAAFSAIDVNVIKPDIVPEITGSVR